MLDGLMMALQPSYHFLAHRRGHGGHGGWRAARPHGHDGHGIARPLHIRPADRCRPCDVGRALCLCDVFRRHTGVSGKHARNTSRDGHRFRRLPHDSARKGTGGDRRGLLQLGARNAVWRRMLPSACLADDGGRAEIRPPRILLAGRVRADDHRQLGRQVGAEGPCRRRHRSSDQFSRHKPCQRSGALYFRHSGASRRRLPRCGADRRLCYSAGSFDDRRVSDEGNHRRVQTPARALP